MVVEFASLLLHQLVLQLRQHPDCEHFHCDVWHSYVALCYEVGGIVVIRSWQHRLAYLLVVISSNGRLIILHLELLLFALRLRLTYHRLAKNVVVPSDCRGIYMGDSQPECLN